MPHISWKIQVISLTPSNIWVVCHIFSHFLTTFQIINIKYQYKDFKGQKFEDKFVYNNAGNHARCYIHVI